MSYTITIAKAAEDDIRKAFLWYESQKEFLGNSFETHITSAIENILDNPLKFQIRYGNTRIFLLKKFPYGIHFNVNQNNILIIAVFHTSRDSGNWKNK